MVNKEIETQEIDEKTVVQDVQILESCIEKTVISEEDSSTQIVNELPEKNTEKKAKKKKNPIVSFFKGIFIFLLTIILIIVIWCGYSAINRKKSLSLLPTDYSVYLKTDSVWKALRPIIDLQAADIILSSSELAQIRGALMSFRQSSLKDSKIVEFLGSRPVDIGLYLEEGKSDFVGILDLGFLSSVTRISNWVAPFLRIKDFSLVNTDDGFHFEFISGESTFYIKPFYNTLIISSTKALLDKACEANNDKEYTYEELELLTKKTSKPIQIIADAKKLITSFSEGVPTISQISGLLSNDSKALVSLSIKDSEILMNAEIPLEKIEGIDINPSLQGVSVLANRESSMPQMLSRLTKLTQYYTIINAGSFEEITKAVFPLLPEEVNVNSLWKTAGTLCKTFFSITLEDLLFSWTGDECGVLGLEGMNAPVFVLQVKDEQKRREVFDNVLSSIVLQDDKSLILNGVRLPKIYLPNFLQRLIKAFGINMPNPYYLVHDGFVYFSESPEVLAAFYNGAVDGLRISENQNWKTVSEKRSLESTISFFYDLERSEPFFVRGDNIIAQILELYSIGCCDIRIKDSSLIMDLTVSSNSAKKIRTVAGFPKILPGKTEQLQLENDKNPSYIFWVEDNQIIKSMDLKSMEIKEKKMSANFTSILASNNTSKKDGVLWAVTQDGGVYSLNEDLSVVDGFPLLLDTKPRNGDIAVAKDALYIVLSNNQLIKVDVKGSITKIGFNSFDTKMTIWEEPVVLGDKIAFYERGFLGNIYLYDESLISKYKVTGLSYGIPAMMEKNGAIYTGFITQAGNLKIWKEPSLIENEAYLSISLKDVFWASLVSDGEYFYALSKNGTVYRVSLDGEVLAVQIPNATAQEGVLSVVKVDGSSESNIYVGIDGNLIYGFNKNLEMLTGFPVVGSKKPVFADGNGDGKAECITLSIDNKLYMWNLR